MSLGLAAWKAPLQMKSTWSVLTLPCFVATVQPSMSGSRSRCTPSLEGSVPASALFCMCVVGCFWTAHASASSTTLK